MAKTVLYICVGTAAVGETDNAVRFATDLEKVGFSSHFLAFPFGAQFIKQNHLSADQLGVRKKDNYRIFAEVCQTIRPDWILVADGYYFDLWFGPKHIFDLKWILDNPVGAQCATFDNLCLSLKNASLLLYDNPALEDKFRWLHTTDLTNLMPVLIPCPLGFPPDKPTHQKSPVLYYRRPAEQLLWNEIQKKDFRNGMGLEAEEKLALLAIAGWALQLAQTLTENPDAWLKHFSRMIETIFESIPEKTTVIAISDYPVFANRDVGCVRVINWQSIPFHIYSKLLVSSDLFLTTNAMSTSLAHAVMSRVPAGCLMSSGRDYKKTGTIPSELLAWFETAEDRYPDLLRPYLVFPGGWQEILGSLFEENPFTSTFEFLDTLDPAGTIKTINSLLFDGEKKKSVLESQEKYIQQLAALPGPRKIMKDLIE